MSRLEVLTLMMMVVLSEAESYSGKVLLVSMDGFRWDYVKNVSGLRHFPDMAATGCTVDYVNATFITKTYPCHYSIVTGLYQESHGLVANHIYDRTRDAYFHKSSTDGSWYEEAEPIWVTVEKQNPNSTGVYLWPGGQSSIHGHRPSVYATNKSAPFQERVQTAIGWFADGGKDFVALYFNEPDSTGHRYGPASNEVADKVREMDGILGSILQTLEDRNLQDIVNVIVTSDHGMTETNMQDRLMNLWDYINHTLVDEVPDSEAVTAILPKAGQEEEVFRQAAAIPHVTAYRKEDIPDHFHYKHNDRIMPIIVVSDEGWTLSSNVTNTLWWNSKGGHGFSDELPSMKNIFFARGPDFGKGKKLTSIRSVDIYPLLCRLLNIQGAPNNGSEANTAPFLATGASAGGTRLQMQLTHNLALLPMLSLLSAWIKV